MKKALAEARAFLDARCQMPDASVGYCARQL